MSVHPYAKTVIAVVGAVAAAASLAFSDGVVSPDEWITIALAAATALGVWAVPNKPSEG